METPLEVVLVDRGGQSRATDEGQVKRRVKRHFFAPDQTVMLDCRADWS